VTSWVPVKLYIFWLWQETVINGRKKQIRINPNIDDEIFLFTRLFPQYEHSRILLSVGYRYSS
jgi:hypothetical protein